MDQLKEEMREIRADIKKLLEQGAVHNELLRTHEARSLELKSRQDLIGRRLEPVEEHVKFVSSFLKWMGGIAATATAALLVQLILRLAF